jgi:hypothetical protein
MHELSTQLLSKRMFRPIYERRCVIPALCSVSTEHQSIQSNRAIEQSAAEQPAGHMTRALLSRVSPLAADCDVCACSAVVPLGVITRLAGAIVHINSQERDAASNRHPYRVSILIRGVLDEYRFVLPHQTMFL